MSRQSRSMGQLAGRNDDLQKPWMDIHRTGGHWRSELELTLGAGSARGDVIHSAQQPDFLRVTIASLRKGIDVTTHGMAGVALHIMLLSYMFTFVFIFWFYCP